MKKLVFNLKINLLRRRAATRFQQLCLNEKKSLEELLKEQEARKKALVEYPPAYNHLNVCFGIYDGGENCTYKCAKCMRTLLNLEAWNAVDLFKNVFDLNYYYSHREEYLAELWRGYLQNNSFATEMKPYFKNKKWPLKVKIKAAMIVFKKAFKKMLRLGKVAKGEFKSR